MDITGTNGRDVLNGTAASDRIFGLGDNDYINGGEGADTLDGGAGNDTIYGLSGADSILGGEGNDSLDGGENGDWILGGAGNDTLIGGGGTDTLDGGDGLDVAVYFENRTALVVDMATGLVSFPGQSWPSERLIAIEGVWTGWGNDLITGDGRANDLRGSSGNDTITGGGGNDWIEGGRDSDTLDGGAGNDTIYGAGSAYSYDVNGDLILGGAGNDQLFGSDGDDTLDGGTGTDRIEGRAGFDTVLYEANTTQVVIDLVAGTASFTGQTWPAEVLLRIEGAVTGSGADRLTGNDEANYLSGGLASDTLVGGAGNDTLVGGGGTDSIDGGAGNDMAVYAENTTAIRANLGTGVITFVGQSWPAETLVSIESLQTGSGNDTITGTSADNTILAGAGRDSLTGGAGNDHLDGGAGIDTLVGGLGDDTYVVDHISDRVTESSASGGVDTVISSVNFQLGANVENLTLVGSNAYSGQGNGLANILTGTDGSTILIGGAGNDTLIGGLGDDQLEGGDGNDVLAGGGYTLGRNPGVEYGTDFDPQSPLLYDGKDRIDGGTGVDTLVYNQYIFDNGGGYSWIFLDSAVRVDLAAGTARTLGYSGNDTLISIENVVTGNGDDTVIGNGGANDITVNYGFNTVEGGGGNDTIHGGQGLRFPYYFGDADHVYGIEDTVEVLNGGSGNDVIYSGGSVVYYDQFHAWSQGLTTDVLRGDAGNDRLIADAGNFIMTGGSGADRFEFSTELFENTDYVGVFETFAQQATITDFSQTQGDKILISGAGGVSFVGEDAEPDVWELGYHTEANGDETDTVVVLNFGEQLGYNNPVLMTLTLAGFTGTLTQNDFLLT